MITSRDVVSLLGFIVGLLLVEHASARCINQADFNRGTFIIRSSGRYKLCEDIVFNPNGPAPGETPEDDAFDPNFEDGYDKNAFGLGYFAAIVIGASNVTISLNGHTIEQSQGHALMQRFFSVIELAEAPFIADAGPAQFVGEGNTFDTISDIQIRGPGTIGRSSHHGIHGNQNSNVKIREVTFKDFEVAAISLNNVDSLTIKDCDILQNRQDVPVTGLFSAARFLRPYGKALKNLGYTMRLRGEETSAAVVYDALIESINKVYADVMTYGYIQLAKHPMEYHLFHNPFGVIDGPCYGLLVHGKGPAVEGFGMVYDEADETTTSSNVVIKRNTIQNIKCWVNEVPAAVEDEKVVKDARGSVFQFVRSFDNRNLSISRDGRYTGNVVADMQIMVAKAISEGLIEDLPERQTSTNSIGRAIIDWASTGTTTYSPSFRCNGDSMFHNSKGITVIRIDETAGFIIKDNTISDVENLSVAPFKDCTDFHLGASEENIGEQQGGNIRGISVAAVRGYKERTSSIRRNSVTSMTSAFANTIIGVDIQGDSSSIKVRENFVDLQSGVGEDPSDEYIACRVRSYVQNVTLKDNELKQEEEILNTRRQLKAKLPEGHPTGEIERNSGGCPFARRRKL